MIVPTRHDCTAYLHVTPNLFIEALSGSTQGKES